MGYVVRSFDVTVFEISMLGVEENSFCERCGSLSYVAPYALIQAIISYLLAEHAKAGVLALYMSLFVFLSLYMYTGFSLLLGLVSERKTRLIVAISGLFLMPFSAVLLLSNYSMVKASLGLGLFTCSVFAESSCWFHL